MTGDDSFYLLALHVRPGEASGVEQHVAHVVREGLPVPQAEVIELVSAEEEPLEAKRRQPVIEGGEPLRHAVVVSVLRLERELEIVSRDGRCQASAVAPNPPI